MIGGTPSKKGKKLVIQNGELENYLSDSQTIDKNTFVQITNGKVKTATTGIDGVTKTKCTTTNAGKVYVLGGA